MTFVIIFLHGFLSLFPLTDQLHNASSRLAALPVPFHFLFLIFSFLIFCFLYLFSLPLTFQTTSFPVEFVPDDRAGVERLYLFVKNQDTRETVTTFVLTVER